MLEGKDKKVAAIILAAIIFFLLGLVAGFLTSGKGNPLSGIRTEFKNPDSPPRIKGPTTPPPKL